jgi:hypothetical protein
MNPKVQRWKNPHAPTQFDIDKVGAAFANARHQLRGLAIQWAYVRSGEGAGEVNHGDVRYTDEIQAELARVDTAVQRMLGDVLGKLEVERGG